MAARLNILLLAAVAVAVEAVVLTMTPAALEEVLVDICLAV
jgi:hypothetical protein